VVAEETEVREVEKEKEKEKVVAETSKEKGGRLPRALATIGVDMVGATLVKIATSNMSMLATISRLEGAREETPASSSMTIHPASTLSMRMEQTMGVMGAMVVCD
jgi:hypothetical protein